MNITYNSKTPEQVNAWLATYPVLTHSEIKGEVTEVPMHDGMLYGDSYRGDAIWSMTFHLKKTDLDKKKRKVRQWLSGEGTLVMSDTTDSFYEVKRVAITEDYRKSMTYGRIGAEFTVYPYEFLTSGNTGIAVTGTTTIANEHDESMPLYKITGSGSGTLTVNGQNMGFTMTAQDVNLYIDTRKARAYNEAGASKNSALDKDYDLFYLKAGNNSVSISSGFTVTVYPRWGYVI